jgi:ketosteroid isomerase-like protein
MRFCLLMGCLGMLAIAAGCSQGNSTADAQAVKARNEAWSKDAASKDAAKFGTYYADDATVMMPNEPVFRGADSIKAVLVPTMQDPNFALSFKAEKIEASGILAYVQGTYSRTTTARDGKPFVDTGKSLSVWRKQADGSWKVIEDIFNSDLPPGGN